MEISLSDERFLATSQIVGDSAGDSKLTEMESDVASVSTAGGPGTKTKRTKAYRHMKKNLDRSDYEHRYGEMDET